MTRLSKRFIEINETLLRRAIHILLLLELIVHTRIPMPHDCKSWKRVLFPWYVFTTHTLHSLSILVYIVLGATESFLRFWTILEKRYHIKFKGWSNKRSEKYGNTDAFRMHSKYNASMSTNAWTIEINSIYTQKRP